MMNNLLRSAAILAFLALGAYPGTLRAQTYTWDPNGTNGTSPGGAVGTWDASSLFWFNGTNDVAWGTGGNLAEFGGTAGTVNVSGAIAGVNGITFSTTGYTITGGTSLTLTAPTITLGGTSGFNATIATPLAGTVGLTLTGGGTLNLTSTTNTLTGTYTINAGNTLVAVGDVWNTAGNAVTVNGTLALTTTTLAGTGRYINNLLGNGTLTNAGTGTTAVSYRIKQGVFSGNIINGPTAPTAILIEATAGLLDLSGTNTYTGDTLVRNSGIVRLSSAGALPTNSPLRMVGGTLELTAAYGDISRPLGVAGSQANVIAFEAAGTSSNFAAIGADRNVTVGTAGSTLTWGTAPFAPTNIGFGSANATNMVTWNNAIAAGATARTINVVNGPAAIEGRFTGNYTGTSTLNVTGGGTVQFDAGLTAAGYRFNSGTVILNNGTSASTVFSSIGVNSGDNATLTIQGSANFTQSGDFNITDLAGSRGTLNVNTTGTMNFSGGTGVFFGKTSAIGIVNYAAGTWNMTNTLIVGSAGTGVGVFNLSGGTFNQTAGGEGGLGGLNTGNPSAYGYMNMTGGTVNIGGPAFQNSGPAFQVGRFGIGVLDQTAGTINTGSWTDAARQTGSFGLINVSGTAVFNQNSTANRLFVGEQGRGYINVFGGGVIFAKGGTTIGNDANGSGILNILTGGTYNTQYITRVSTSPEGRLYLNGGIIKPTAANANWINTLNSATVGPAGGTLDTAGFDVTITQVLSGPTGQGLTTIPVTTGGSNYFGRPILNITGGGGTGATAIANVTAGVITSITITNPGNDYTSAPTIAIIGGGVGNGIVTVTAPTFGTPTLAANPVDGGLIKTGNGVLTLSGANTYTGALTITAGTVAVPTINDNGTAGPLGQQATAAGLVFNGGTLRYTGATVTSTGRTFSATGSNPIILDVSTAATNLTFAGIAPVTANAITKVGAGVLTPTFINPENFTGVYNANAGILSPVGTYANTFNVNTGGRLNANYQAVAALTVPKLTLGTSSGLDFDFTPGGAGTSNDTIIVTNASNGLTLGTTSLNLYQVGGTTAFSENGTYPLLKYTTGFSGTLAGAFSVANSVVGKVYSVNNNTTLSQLELVINDAVTAAWAVDGGGSWNVGANWTSTPVANTVPNSVGAVATFGAAYTGATPPAIVTLDGNKTVGSLAFSNANSYSIVPGTGGTITIDNGIAVPLVTATLGSHTVNVPVALVNPTNFNADTGASLTFSAPVTGPATASLTKLGAGSITFSGGATLGAVTVSAGTLTFTGTNSVGATTLTTGSLTFSGPTTFGSTITMNAGTLLLSAANTITSPILVGGGLLEAANAGALGASTGLTVRNGATLRASAAGVIAPATTLDINGGTATGLSGAANAVGNFTLDVTTGSSLTINGNLTNGSGSATKIGGGTLTLTGATNSLSNTVGISFAIQNGTLTLNGPANATYTVSGELDIGDNTPNNQTLNVNSGTLTGNSFLSISRGTGSAGLTQTLNVAGTVNVLNLFTGFANGVAGYSTNSVINLTGAGSVTATNAGRFSESAGNRTTVTMAGTGTYFVQNNLEVGFGGVAQVLVGAGTTLNANQFLFGNNGGSGAVLNRGTLVDRSAASTSHFALGNTPNSYGYYLHDTTVGATLQEIGIGGAGATAATGGGNGLLEVRSGTLTSAQWVTMNRTTSTTVVTGFGSTSSLLVTGGVFNVPNIAGRFYANQTATNPLYAKIEVDAGRIAAGNLSDINLNNAANAGNISTLTVSNGGIVETTRIFAAQATTGSVRAVNFNNGTLRATASTTNLLDASLSSVTIHDGGMTIDTNGFNSSLGIALTAPTGNGITTIPVLTGGTGYIGRPIVQITDASGSGSGASAYATINETTGVVTGITITSPGNNYISPVITLVGGGSTTAATIDAGNILLNPAAGTGGLTKTGAGVLTLTSSSNNYGGATVINGGTLLVANTAIGVTGNGPVTVNTSGNLAGGTATTGFISGVVTVNSGGSLSPGSVNLTTGTSLVGNLSLGGLTLTTGSIINHQITDATTGDLITVFNPDSLTINGGGYNLTNTTTGTAFSTNGVYNLISYQGSILGTGPSALSVLNPVNGKTYAFGTNAGYVTLTVSTTGGVPNFWNVDADGNWTDTLNWTLGAPNAPAAFANFGGGGTPTSAPRTVTLNANQTVGAVAFNSANAFTIAGTNTLTFNNGADATAQITVTLGNHIIQTPIAIATSITSTQVNVVNATDSLDLTGPISGTTSSLLKMGAGVLTLSGNNNFVGTTTLSNGTLNLASTTALGGSTGLTVNSGTLLRFTATGATTVTSPVTFALGGGIAGGANAGGNGTGNYNVETAGGNVTFTGLVSNASGSLVKTGPATLTLTNPGANTLANVGGQAVIVQNGTLTLNGGSSATYGVTGELTVGDNTPNAAVMNVLSGTLNVSSFLSVGRGNGTSGLTSALNVTDAAVNAGLLYTGYANGVGGYNAAPTVTISGGSIVTVTGTTRLSESAGGNTTFTISGTSTFTESADFQVGYGGNAVVSVGGSATMNIAGLGLGNGNNTFGNTGAGVIRQTAGNVLQAGGGGQGDWRIGGFNGANDVNAYGSYMLSGGNFSSGGRNIQVGAYGVGVMDIAGGTWTSTGGYPVVGRFIGGNGLLNVTSGTFSQNGTGNLLIIGEEGTGTFNLSGGSVTLLAGAAAAGNGGGTGGLRLGHTATGVGSFNMNGGTLTTTGIAKSNATGVANVYLNGGTIKAGAANATFLQGLDSVVLGSAGTTIDTNGNAITIGQGLAAPTGSGITTIPLLNGGAGYLGRPIVTITGGGGTGASAVANVVGGVITSITITNPGVNYTSPPTVTLLAGGTTTPAATDDVNIALTTNAATGGLTKVGAGTLALNGANTYGGTTTVTTGTLRGSGSIAGPVVVNDTIRGGSSTAAPTLTLGNGLTVNSGARLYLDVFDGTTHATAGTGGSTASVPTPTTNNFLSVTGGTASIHALTNITVDGTGATFTAGTYSYQVASVPNDLTSVNITNPSQFTFANMNGVTVGNYSLTGGSGALYLNFEVTAVPEPVFVFGLLAAAALGARMRKRRS